MTSDCKQAREARKALKPSVRRRWSAPGPNGAMWFHHGQLGKTYDGHKSCGYVLPYEHPEFHVFACSYQFIEVSNGISSVQQQCHDFPTFIQAMMWIMERANEMVLSNAQKAAA